MKIKKNWIRVVIFTAILALACVGLYFFLPKIVNLAGFLISLFLPFLLGYLFSMLVNPLADTMQKKLKIPRGLSAVLVIILIVGILGGVITFAVWKIVDESRMLYTQFPVIYENAKNNIHAMGEKFSNIYVSMPQNIQQSLAALGDTISSKAANFINTKSSPMVNYAGNFAKALPSVFISVIVFLLSAYFMVSENRAVHKAVKTTLHKIFSERFYERIYAVKQELKKYLGGYVRAQGILMIISFIIMFIGLTILRIEYALLIALCVAIVDALPFFGSGLILWPWTAIAFLNGNIKLGIGLIIIYAAVMVMRRFAEPKLVSTGMGLNPIPTLMSMYIGYKTLSIGGLILGPIILMIIISFYKAGIFDAPIRIIKAIGTMIKKQCILFKKFFINLMESDDNER